MIISLICFSPFPIELFSTLQHSQMGVTCSKKNKIASLSIPTPPLSSFLPPSSSFSETSSFSQPLPLFSPPPLLNPISPSSRPHLSQFSPVNSNDRRSSQYSLSVIMKKRLFFYFRTIYFFRNFLKKSRKNWRFYCLFFF